MESFIFVGMIGFLKNCYIISAALVKIGIILTVHRINLQANNPEIFPSNLAGFSNVFHCGFLTAFPSENQDFLKSALGNGCHFLVNFLIGKLGSTNVVVTVKATVDAEVFTVISNIDRGKKIN